jgi:hypothetical protein
MVAAKAIALAMRRIAADTAVTSNAVLRLISSSPSAFVAFQAIEASYMRYFEKRIPPIVFLLVNF